jgi:flavin reductase (DIM6/NTAB) family NADH-FMN oxidoreductase RutF
MTARIAINTQGLDGTAAYKLISGAVVPRPIAWVASLNDDKTVNLAPFSSYIFLTHDPPKIGISIGPGTVRFKDTLRNIERNRTFTVNSVSAEQLKAMVETSRLYPPGDSEADDLGIALTPSLNIAAPRIAASEVSLECDVERIEPLNDRDAHHLVIARVVTFQIAPDVFQGDRLDPQAYRPVGRIGGPLYAMPGDIRHVQATPDPRLKPR